MWLSVVVSCERKSVKARIVRGLLSVYSDVLVYSRIFLKFRLCDYVFVKAERILFLGFKLFNFHDKKIAKRFF